MIFLPLSTALWHAVNADKSQCLLRIYTTYSIRCLDNI